MMRTYTITDNRVTFYTLVPFKNHRRTHYRPAYAKSFWIKPVWVKKLLAMAWIARIL